MKKFEVLLVVKNSQPVLDKLSSRININIAKATDEEAAIEQMQQKEVDIIVYEGGADFSMRNKLKSMQKMLVPHAEIIEYDERNLNALPDDLEIAMQKINDRYDGKPQFFDGL
ncbi:MAG: hypothetical protein ACK5NK_14185 [Niabella sp.]